MNKVISFIQPSRNNLKYLKWSYNSIRKNLGYRHEICVFSDFSNDGTVEWCEEIAKKDGSWVHAKLGVITILEAFNNASATKANRLITRMINYAASKSEDASVYVKVSN